MVSPTPFRLPLVPFLVLLCFSPSCSAGRVSVSVYYETLCPFCSGFVVNDLARIFHDGVSSIVDLRLVPFGNGRVSVDGSSITCQISHVAGFIFLARDPGCVCGNAAAAQPPAEMFLAPPPDKDAVRDEVEMIGGMLRQWRETRCTMELLEAARRAYHLRQELPTPGLPEPILGGGARRRRAPRDCSLLLALVSDESAALLLYAKANGDYDHGEDECQLNAIEACVIRLWPDAEQHFTFIHCVEHLALRRKWDAWQSCFLETGLASQPVIDCYNSGYGRQLELQYAAETNALKPPHQFVPWVVINGKPLVDDYMNFEAYICSAYDGELPEACKGKHLAIAEHTRASRGDKRSPHEVAIALAIGIALWL
ncbi:hypothetical protein EJB05_56917 [Eragrostis curvula]|uniref:Saposin A-type domain-containing protein n=1 Tax=Eragrostis curvula TaxID=38414 RepID=A0A5J9SEX3_9POAL|nr:hypothetical protein EJB05_56917 [Eragrostis curvula]